MPFYSHSLSHSACCCIHLDLVAPKGLQKRQLFERWRSSRAFKSAMWTGRQRSSRSNWPLPGHAWSGSLVLSTRSCLILFVISPRQARERPGRSVRRASSMTTTIEDLGGSVFANWSVCGIIRSSLAASIRVILTCVKRPFFLTFCCQLCLIALQSSVKKRGHVAFLHVSVEHCFWLLATRWKFGFAWRLWSAGSLTKGWDIILTG